MTSFSQSSREDLSRQLDDSEHISVYDFLELFPDDEAAIAFMEEERWPGGVVVCAHCNSVDTTPLRRQRKHQCNECRKQFSVRTGTVFECSRIPLYKWLYAMYMMQTARKGISSIQLSKELGISQPSAWFLLHRLRHAMEIIDVTLEGVVEVDEVYLGGIEKYKHAKKKIHAGRGTVGKQTVLGMRQRDGPTVAIPVGPDEDYLLLDALFDTIPEGSTIYTDHAKTYWGLKDRYIHFSVNHSIGEYVNGDVTTNSIESVWALVKRSYRGVFHFWAPKNSQRYMNEILFRVNHKGPVMESIRATIRGAEGRRLTYEELRR